MADPLRLVDIRETPLDVDEVLAAVDDAAAGGVTLFVGKVRDHDGGRDVTGLDYTAHPTALDRLTEVCRAVAGKYDVHAIAAVHRIGTLAIGDAAVVIATSAAHRGVAFDASRELIDTLKATVPIWKHQTFTDGTEEWVGAGDGGISGRLSNVEILWWLAPPVVVTVLAMLWVSWLGREGRGEVDREVAVERLAKAMRKDHPGLNRPGPAQSRPRDRSTGIAVRPSRRPGEDRRSA
jgi:molybdopterin synthase catalytic subunit